MGPKYCLYISPDDKASCPIGIPAATRQGKVLMHLDYKVKLPDHQYIVAGRHKLKPSVYGMCNITPTIVGHCEAVGYSGPTAIRVRSCKHDKSTSYTHMVDLKKLLTGEECGQEWKSAAVDSEGKSRPVLILRPDGGPDQNPRHPRNQNVYGKLFKDLDLDTLIVALYPEGYSAFNPVERRMAPLSRELIGVIFEHQHFGQHLNSAKETTDLELEKRNFAYAGKALADLWHRMPENGRSIGGYDVDSRWVDPASPEDREDVAEISEAWKCKHMLRSRYFVMFKKCLNVECCLPLRSPILKRLPSGFLPSPRVFKHNEAGDLQLAPLSEVGKQVKYATLSNILSQPFQQDIPFDTYNPKVKLKELLCPFCDLSMCTHAEQKRHRRAMHRGRRAPRDRQIEVEELEEVEDIVEVIDEDGEHFLCVLEDDEDIEWRKLPPTHPLINKFRTERKRLLESVANAPIEIPNEQLGAFMSSVFEDV